MLGAVTSKDLQTLFREEVGTPNVSIKVRGLVDSNIFNILGARVHILSLV